MRAPGKYTISNEEYHADKDYFSSSTIKEALESPGHFKYYNLQGNKVQKDYSHLTLGSAVHTVLLEPHLFDSEYVVYDGELTTTGLIPAKEKKIITAAHPGKKIITKPDYEFAQQARVNCNKYDQAAKLLFSQDGESEPSYFNKCTETGLNLRIRPDRIDLTNKFIVDVKTSQSVNKEDFRRDAIYKYHYDLSAYMYLMQIYLMFGIECDFYWIVVGKESMVPVAVYKLSRDTIENGKKKFFRSVDNIKTALVMPDEAQYQTRVEEI
jgi:hypothetical protein